MQERIWEDHAAGGLVRPFRPDGAFFRELTVRLGRPWLADTGRAPQTGLVLGGPLHTGPLLDCMGAFTRIRRGQQGPRGIGLDPWWLRADHRPVSARVQLRALPSRSRTRATPLRTAVPGLAAVRRQLGGCSATGTGAPPRRTTGPVTGSIRGSARRGGAMGGAAVCTDTGSLSAPSSAGRGDAGCARRRLAEFGGSRTRARLTGAHDRHAPPVGLRRLRLARTATADRGNAGRCAGRSGGNFSGI